MDNSVDNSTNSGDQAKCPFPGVSSIAKQSSAGRGTRNNDWWPHQLKLNIHLQAQAST